MPGRVYVTATEVTQGVQTYAVTDRRVPLLAWRRTYMRVLVRADPDANGDWTGVTAQLTVEGSRAGALSPVNQFSITVPATGSHRNTLDDSFLFELDPIDTRDGTRGFTVELIPPAGRPMGDSSGLRADGSMTFESNLAGLPVIWAFYGVRYRYVDIPPADQVANGLTSSTWPERPWSDLELDSGYAACILPVAYLALSEWPGNPVHDVEWADTYTAGRAWATQLADMLPLAEGEGFGVVVLQPEITDRYQGLCQALGNGAFCINYHGTFLNGSSPPLDYGTTLAHELGHSMGLCHTPNVDATNGCQDLSFRRADGSVGDYIGVGPLPPTSYPAGPDVFAAVPGENPDGTVAECDFMSYSTVTGQQPVRWPSPYMYCKAMKGSSVDSIDPAGIDFYAG
jgi:hypothetical protein